MHSIANSIWLWVIICGQKSEPTLCSTTVTCVESKPSELSQQWTTCIGRGYQESQVCSKYVAMWLFNFSKILEILTRLIVVSMHGRTKNSTIPCGVDAGNGPWRSTATSSQSKNNFERFVVFGGHPSSMIRDLFNPLTVYLEVKILHVNGTHIFSFFDISACCQHVANSSNHDLTKPPLHRRQHKNFAFIWQFHIPPKERIDSVSLLPEHHK